MPSLSGVKPTVHYIVQWGGSNCVYCAYKRQRFYTTFIQAFFCSCHDFYVFSARRHICYSALYAIARPSVRPSVRLSHGWINQKRLKQLSPQSSPMTLVSSWLISPRNSKGNTGSGNFVRTLIGSIGAAEQKSPLKISGKVAVRVLRHS